MERSFMSAEDCAKLKKFAQIMHIQGGLTRITNDAWLQMQMALCSVIEPDQQPGETHTVLLFGDKVWCYLLVRFCGNADPNDNGLAALRVKRDYLLKQFAPGGVPDPGRMKKIFNAMLALLDVPPNTVDLNRLTSYNLSHN